MKRFLVLALIVISISSLLAEKINFHGGKSETVRLKKFDGENFILEDGKIARNDVRKIILTDDSQKAEGSTDGMKLFWPYDSLDKIAKSYEERYPGARGIIILDHGKDVLRSDGTQFYQYHFAGKILKSDMFYLGTRTLWFDEGRSSVALTGARVIYPDGKIKLWNPSDYTISAGSGEAVHFDNDVYYSATLPEVTVGCIVEYVYERNEYNPYDKKMYFPGWYFGDDIPVHSSKFEVSIPKDKDLNYRITSFPDGADTEPVIVKDDSSKTYTWHLTDIEPFVEEPNMPNDGDVLAHVEGTLFEDYDYIYNWLGEMQRSRMEITPEIEQKVKEVTEGYSTLDEKIAAIYYFIQREIEYISIKASVSSGQTGHEAQFTLDNKYGDCTDKSILLCTMYRALGLESRPVIIMTNDDETIDRSLPTYSGNHAITLLEYNDEKIFLDGTYTAMQFPYCGDWDMGTSYLDAVGKETGFTSIIDPELNSKKLVYEISLDRDGSADFFRQDILKGPYECSYRSWWEYYPESRWNELSANYLNTYVPGSELESLFVDGVGELFEPLVEKYYFSTENYASIAANLMLFQIPGLEKSYSFDEVSLQERKYPIQYEAPYSLGHDARVKIPEKTSIDYLPEKLEIENKYITYSGSYEIVNNDVHFTDTYILKERIIPVEDYDLYRDALLQIANFARKQIVLNIEM